MLLEAVEAAVTPGVTSTCKLSRRSASTASAAPINSCKGMSIRLLLAVALLLELELFGLDPAEAEAA